MNTAAKLEARAHLVSPHMCMQLLLNVHVYIAIIVLRSIIHSQKSQDLNTHKAYQKYDSTIVYHFGRRICFLPVAHLLSPAFPLCALAMCTVPTCTLHRHCLSSVLSSLCTQVFQFLLWYHVSSPFNCCRNFVICYLVSKFIVSVTSFNSFPCFLSLGCRRRSWLHKDR